MKRLLVIVNPHAGKGQIKTRLADVLDLCVKAGYRAEVYITQGSGDATTVVRRRGAHVDRVICSGGDGTLSETINGLMQLPPEKRPELGYISAGTTNDFAHSLKLPARILDAAQVAVGGAPFPVDIGRVNDAWFCYLVGFGAFTEVSYATSQALKRQLGHTAYIMEAAKELMDLKPWHVRAVLGEEIFESDFLCGFVSNSNRVAGMSGIWGKDIRMDDGLFEVTLIRMPSDIVGWGEAVTTLLSPEARSNLVIRRKANHLHFFSEAPVDWVKDGEFAGSFTEVEVEALLCPIRILRKPDAGETVGKRSECAPKREESAEISEKM
ncbi:MAG: YegS/Rv2252/BmrU family lipid kinase [Lachnospiraceae bacterium]|nr:YegS/Rv2252/BmrU family lipid kinase [Lachnospiraceae bacterium]